ncbi:hypothetical protein C4D60_Mb11t18730 [Musa balbisiana]|uniref:Major facilitator superfamily (MFS) profile domain-containing protein n=1 Tax=Musa balbisiana TaxID=52838 RepID=A0A4S8J549_MUSBA|nr:hypothetical protein C4D60_Mb11t18730 [Musa balbisiana]
MMGVGSPLAIGNGKVDSKVKYHSVDVAEEGEDDEAFAGRRRKSPESHGKTYVRTCAFFASLNSVLLGYDVGVMSGAILFIQKDLHITEVEEEVLVGCLSIISLLGSLAGGRTSDAVGRKWTMALAAIIFQIGAAIMALAPSFPVLMIGRLLAGVGIGFGVMIAPVYIAEISPAAARGSLTSFPEIFINLGILLGYISNYAFSGLSEHVNWRIMLGVGILPSVFIGFALFVIPESPRWLVMQKRAEEARSVLSKIIDNEGEVERRLAEIEKAAGAATAIKWEEKAVWKELLSPSPSLRRMLIVGCGIQCFQQITGIDATVYYSPTIFRDAGIKSDSELLAATIAVGVTKTCFILVAIFLIDRVGRKPLLYASTMGMTLCLFLLGVALSLNHHGTGLISPAAGIGLAIVAVCGNVAFFSVGIGPICWVLSSEIFPLRLRAQASALGAVGNRLSSGLVAMSFLSVSRAITVAGTFFIFSAISALSVAFVYYCVPETKGKVDESASACFPRLASRKPCVGDAIGWAAPSFRLEIGDSRSQSRFQSRSPRERKRSADDRGSRSRGARARAESATNARHMNVSCLFFQVRELHRLYWTQKNLMNDVRWRRSNRVSSLEAQKERKGPVEEVKSGSVRHGCSTAKSMGMQNTSFELRANDRRNFVLQLPAGLVKVDFSATEVKNKSGHSTTAKYSHTVHQTERWQELDFIHSDAGLEENGGSVSANFPTTKQQPEYKLTHIDLNMAQDDESNTFFSNTVETLQSPSTSSSIVHHGDDLRVSSIKSEQKDGSAKESTVTEQLAVVSHGSENSREKSADSLPREHIDSYPSSVQASEQNNNAIENIWSYKECIVNNEDCRSGIRIPEACYKNLLERFSSAYNGGTQDSTNRTVLAGLHKPGMENIDSFISPPNLVVHGDSKKNILISSKYREHNCLHASAGSTTDLPPKAAGDVEEKETNIDGSEEDTVSSHAIVPDECQQIELKESPIGFKPNQLARNSECASKEKSVADHAVISKSENSATTHIDSVTPERICSQQVSDVNACDCICIQDKQILEQQLALVEVDHVIIKAAETLASISSEKPLCSVDQLTSNGRMEFYCEEGNDQPQSSDSFEMGTLNLEEIRDNGISTCAKQIDNETRKDVCKFKLGRGMRDFQKDILPGIISLSRHEICEDLYAIKYELGKKRSHRTSEENWVGPVRSRRSTKALNHQ